MTDTTLKAAQAADDLVAAMWPAIEEYTHERGGGAITAAMVLAKPHIRAALSRVEGVEKPADGRTAAYHVSAMFWDIDNGEEEAELVESTDEAGESCTRHGLAACLEQLALWIAELHDGEEVSEEAHMSVVVNRVPSLRVAIGRGSGTGAFRVFYTADGVKMLAHAVVTREAVHEEED